MFSVGWNALDGIRCSWCAQRDDLGGMECAGWDGMFSVGWNALGGMRCSLWDGICLMG